MATSLNLWVLLTHLAGGVGLFLLGMTMMTDGLKLAAGPALERILASATLTRWQALGSGMLVTALVQSSSAITVATIGFVNAGLLSLGSALWVLFGANVGTTVTAMLAAMGATPNARRAASAHVAFNVITGMVALVLLPWLLNALGLARAALGLAALHQQFVNRCDALLAGCDRPAPDPGHEQLEERSQRMEAAYAALKTGPLAACAWPAWKKHCAATAPCAAPRSRPPRPANAGPTTSQTRRADLRYGRPPPARRISRCMNR